MLIDALNLESRDFVSKMTGTIKILEIGVGSGAVINSFQMLNKRNGVENAEYHATDINVKALEYSQKVSELNDCQVNYVECAVPGDHYKDFLNIIIFNPPYVVTS